MVIIMLLIFDPHKERQLIHVTTIADCCIVLTNTRFLCDKRGGSFMPP